MTEQVFDSQWRARTEVRIAARVEVDVLIRRHYLGKWPAVNVAVFGAFIDGIAVGVCVFSLPPRETIKRLGGMTWELSRLWIDDGVPKNGETWFIARCVKYIRRNRRDVRWLVSYADPSAGHRGTIYRAANWVFDGMTDAGRKTPRCDYEWQGRKFSRKSHIPDGAVGVLRIPRVSKYRFVYGLAL